MSAAGAVLDGSGFAISTAPNVQIRPAVVWNGANYLVVWGDARSGVGDDIYGARVSPVGAVLDSSGIPISTAANAQSMPVVAFGGASQLVVWTDSRSGINDIYGTRVRRAGTVLDSTGSAISTAANEQFRPAVAFDGTNYLVVWEDSRPGVDFDIYGARVSPTGAVLDGSGIAISTAAHRQSDPAVTFDGTTYLVVWGDRRSGISSEIYGARVSPAGAVLDGTGIAISSAPDVGSNPAVAFDGTNHLVVWTGGPSITNTDIYGARVSPAGTVLDSSGIAISTATNDQSQPAVAFDGANHLVVWADQRFGANPDVFGARVSPAGAILDSSGIAISTATDNQFQPAVAWNGERYLVVWADGRSAIDYDIFGTRVTDLGVVEDPAGFAISAATESQESPQVAVNGPFLVVWRDRRAGTNDDIYGSRVSNAGAVLDGAGVAIATSVTDEQEPALTGGPPGNDRFGIVYQRFAPEAPYGSNRTFLRTFSK